jgi:formate hydrogenlyase subunit 4
MILLLSKVVAGISLMGLVPILALFADGVDRRVNARMQRRIGPPLLQPFYDIAKLFAKECIVPRTAIPGIFNGGPLVALALSLMIFLYMPMGVLPPVLASEGDLILILYLFAAAATAMALGAFAGGSPYANLGAQREIVLMMSFEFPLALAVCSLAWYVLRGGIPGDPFSLETYAAFPLYGRTGWAGNVGLFSLFLVLLAVAPAESGKAPMDMPEAKTEILEGLIVEYSGRNLALLKLVFALRTTAVSALIVCLFLSGSLGRAVGLNGVALFGVDLVLFWMKVLLVQVFGITLIRTAFGRLRTAQAAIFYWIPVGGLSLAGMALLALDVWTR